MLDDKKNVLYFKVYMHNNSLNAQVFVFLDIELLFERITSQVGSAVYM